MVYRRCTILKKKIDFHLMEKCYFAISHRNLIIKRLQIWHDCSDRPRQALDQREGLIEVVPKVRPANFCYSLF
jgi:hypothetical protein